MITLDALREACRAACACANDGSEPPGTCPACEVWERLKGQEQRVPVQLPDGSYAGCDCASCRYIREHSC